MTTVPIKEPVDEVDERTKPPFLRRVRIRGFKSIAFCDVRLQPLTILVGRNAAGKSNFLDALAFLRDAMNGGIAEAVKRPGGFSGIICATSKTPTPTVEIEIEVGFTCDRPYWRATQADPTVPSLQPNGPPPDFTGIGFTAIYRLACSRNGPHGIPTISRESLEITDEAHLLSASYEVEDGTLTRWQSNPEPFDLRHIRALLSLHRRDLPLLPMLGWQPFIDLGDGLRWMGFYNFHPDAIRSPQTPNPGRLLKKDGHNLVSVLETLKENDPDSVRRVQSYLSAICEEVEDFESLRWGEYERLRFRLQKRPGQSPVEFDAVSMSDGTLRAVATLMAAFQIVLPYGHPSVIGIEEPETALHPAAMRALVDALDEATQHTQVLLTTHSADLLSGRDVKPGQVLVVRNRGGKTQITPVDPASREIIDKELYSLAELQRMDHLDLDEADLKRQERLGNGAEGD